MLRALWRTQRDGQGLSWSVKDVLSSLHIARHSLLLELIHCILVSLIFLANLSHSLTRVS